MSAYCLYHTVQWMHLELDRSLSSAEIYEICASVQANKHVSHDNINQQ